jgi:DNA invertase Pin-like site-specific DNA recombinase
LSIEADLSRRGIGLVILSMGGERLDTRNPTSKLMLTILAGVATWEREIMLERQREGIAKTKAAGKYKGRPVSIDAAQIKQLRAELGPAAIAKRLGIARSSVYRVLARCSVASPTRCVRVCARSPKCQGNVTALESARARIPEWPGLPRPSMLVRRTPTVRVW